MNSKDFLLFFHAVWRTPVFLGIRQPLHYSWTKEVRLTDMRQLQGFIR